MCEHNTLLFEAESSILKNYVPYPSHLIPSHPILIFITIPILHPISFCLIFDTYLLLCITRVALAFNNKSVIMLALACMPSIIIRLCSNINDNIWFIDCSALQLYSYYEYGSLFLVMNGFTIPTSNNYKEIVWNPR